MAFLCVLQVRLWKVPFAPLEPGPVEAEEAAVFEFQGRNAFRAIDYHWRENLFATGGAVVEVWSHERSEPVNTFTWGADSVLSVKFNPVRGAGLAAVASTTCAQR
jgi:WD repeat and SOF domain-containing protein 1